MNYNSLIRQCLAKYGLYQCELADLLGINKATLSRWLNKQELPEQKQLELISVIQKAGEQREQ